MADRRVNNRWDLQPGQKVPIEIERNGQRYRVEVTLTAGSDLADPLLSLFMANDGEWVLWTPQGYYDASLAGESGPQSRGQVLPGAPVPQAVLPPRYHRQGPPDRGREAGDRAGQCRAVAPDRTARPAQPRGPAPPGTASGPNPRPHRGNAYDVPCDHCSGRNPLTERPARQRGHHPGQRPPRMVQEHRADPEQRRFAGDGH